MRIGVPKEIKANENRVGLVPACVRELSARGHDIVVEAGAGLGAGLTDEQYVPAGGKILPDAAAVLASAEMIVKVKEPQPSECAMLRPDQVLFTYLHLAADPGQTEGLRRSGCVAIAYETTRPTTHAMPTFVGEGVVHYCVANMPGGVARTSTFALNNATLPYVIALADKGWRRALADDARLRNGLNVCQGRVTFEAVARDLALDYTRAETFLADVAEAA